MKPEELIKRNIEKFTSEADKVKTFGGSHLQRICRIGYNQAMHTIEAMLEADLIYRCDKPWKYRFKD